jgi:hypothetical protein
MALYGTFMARLTKHSELQVANVPFPKIHPQQFSQRHKFTSNEDVQLRTLVEQMGDASWDEVARLMHGLTARQCRDRYKNYLLNSLVMAPWTSEEESIVRERYRRLGPKWVEIAKSLIGRSGNQGKNRWHRHLARQDGCEGTGPSNEGSTESEDEPKDEGPSVFLCPVLQPRECDWSQLFDKLERSLGYGSAWCSSA